MSRLGPITPSMASRSGPHHGSGVRPRGNSTRSVVVLPSADLAAHRPKEQEDQPDDQDDESEPAVWVTLHQTPARHSRLRWQPTHRLWKRHISIAIVASFVDPKLEKNVTIFRLIHCRLSRHEARCRIIQKGGLAPTKNSPPTQMCRARHCGVHTSLARAGRGL